GDVPGPRIVASGPALGITGGHCDNNLLAPEFNHFDEGVADGVPSVMRKTREVIKYGADVIKICSTGGALSLGRSDALRISPEFNHFDEGVADGVPSVMRKTREVIKYGADVIKICSTGGVLSLGDDPNASQYTLAHMQATLTPDH